jgi:peptide/nickel transport system substrate-binding protein
VTNKNMMQTKSENNWKRLKNVAVGFLVIVTTILASCGTGATSSSSTTQNITKTTTSAPTIKATVTTTDIPQYGGTLTIALNNDPPNWDPLRSDPGDATQNAINLKIWTGDWARGAAGGYGTNEIDWAINNDIWKFKTNLVANSWKWTIDNENDQGTIVYEIRKGIHWAINTDSEASKLVGGREVTADDVVFAFKQTVENPDSYIWGANPELRNIDIVKTGPWEVSVKVPLTALYTAICRFGEDVRIFPPEIVAKYGNMLDWKVSVGNGPFILQSFVQGSSITIVKNPQYWRTDPVGPGKGNQLPYVDSVQELIIPDASTRLAALRTGKIDTLRKISFRDAAQLRKDFSALIEREYLVTASQPLCMRTDQAPFNDIRVRRAMMMAIDFQAINKGLYDSLAMIPTFPYTVYDESPWKEALLGVNDPDFPASAKELYEYNPEKAKQLLAEAGYPEGFQAELMLQSTDVDYYSVIKDYFAKVNIDMKLDVRETGVFTSMTNARNYTSMVTHGISGAEDWVKGLPYLARNYQNLSMIDDAYINDAMAKISVTALTDETEAMALNRELLKYVVQQAYAIPQVMPPTFIFWCPWLKNYNGENTCGNDSMGGWYQYVWIDLTLKKSMGY